MTAHRLAQLHDLPDSTLWQPDAVLWRALERRALWLCAQTERGAPVQFHSPIAQLHPAMLNAQARRRASPRENRAEYCRAPRCRRACLLYTSPSPRD